MSKSILNFADSRIMSNFNKEILSDFEKIFQGIDFIFDQIPSEFGLSKKGKARIVEVLSNEERNLRVSKLPWTI